MFQIKVGYREGSWQITEFLINYQAGFIRRGLLGELLYYFKDYISVYWAILIISFLAFVLLSALLVSIFKKHNMTKWMLVLPFLLGGMVILDFWVRKDGLLLLLFFACIQYLRSEQKWGIIMVLLLFSLALLIHESFIFLIFPYLGIRFYFSNNRDRIRMMVLLPILYLLYLITGSHGNQNMAVRIWNSWYHEFDFPLVTNFEEKIDGSLGALAWTFNEGIGYFKNEFVNFEGGVYSPLFWLVIIILIYSILLNILFQDSNEEKRLVFSNILLIQFVGILPLMVLGWDYGRWMFFWSISSIMLFHLSSKDLVWTELQLLNKVSKYLIKTTGRLNRTAYSVLTLFVGFPPFGWKLSMALDSVPLVYILRVLSLVIEKIIIS
jgi:hypothetical protein